jgi:hypothetical protein
MKTLIKTYAAILFLCITASAQTWTPEMQIKSRTVGTHFAGRATGRLYSF